MIHMIDNEYSYQLLAGAIPAAEELDVNLVIFPGNPINADYYDHEFAIYEYQQSIAYEYCSKDTADGLIISAGTVGSFLSADEMKRFTDKFNELPIITLERKVEGYPCLKYDGKGIYDAVCHLISAHGAKKIGFVGGPAGSDDAECRFEAYKKALEDNNIPYDDRLVAHGNFSEYSMDAVNAVLDGTDSMPDAICFANDGMCIGGYKVFKERGLTVGKDILVTGFDDADTALNLNPMLTTARSSPAQLGYDSVKAMYSMLTSGCAVKTASPVSKLVIRGSCGCSSDCLQRDISDYRKFGRETVRRVSQAVFSEKKKRHIAMLEELAADIMSCFCEDSYSPEKADGLLSRMDALIADGCLKTISPIYTADIFNNLRIAAEKKNGGRKCAELSDFFRRIEHNLFISSHSQLYNDDLDRTYNFFLISNITNDMTIYSHNQEKCYFSIMHKLSWIHMKSSRIYYYEQPIIHEKDDVWQSPDHLMLMGAQDGSYIYIPKDGEKLVHRQDIFDNKDSDRAKISVVNPLFAKESQFGLLVCEAEPEQFRYLHSITSQICTSIRLSSLLNRLAGSLSAEKNTNALLSEISVTDELTRIFNRRGFLQNAGEILKDPDNFGKKAFFVFADLDNLKKINDIFGHDEGDYALISAAKTLSSVISSDGIVGRIGGDEFAAVVLCKYGEDLNKLYDAIKSAAAKNNTATDKDYNISMSLGIYEFRCCEDLTLSEIMGKADAALYKDKELKDHNVYKRK